jgi:hypothetical protein
MQPLRQKLSDIKSKDSSTAAAAAAAATTATTTTATTANVPLMTDDQQSRIFSNIQVILNVHTALLAELEAKYQAWPDKQLSIGPTLVSIVWITHDTQYKKK